MIDIFFQWAYVVTIKDDFAFKLVPVLLYVVMFYHDDHHIDFIKELIKIQYLVLHKFFVGEEGIKGL